MLIFLPKNDSNGWCNSYLWLLKWNKTNFYKKDQLITNLKIIPVSNHKILLDNSQDHFLENNFFMDLYVLVLLLTQLHFVRVHIVLQIIHLSVFLIFLTRFVLRLKFPNFVTNSSCWLGRCVNFIKLWVW